MATCNIATLINQACANEFASISTDAQFRALVLQLLCNLSGGGTGGSIVAMTQQIYEFAGDPNGNVTPTNTLPCMCIDTVNHITWYKTDHLLTSSGWGSP